MSEFMLGFGVTAVIAGVIGLVIFIKVITTLMNGFH